MPTIFKPFSKERCARCSDFPIYNDKENYPGYYESSREYRINGYCSNYCEDMAEVEDREIDLESKLLNEALKRESVLKAYKVDAFNLAEKLHAANARIEELENVVKSFLKEPYDDSDLKSLLKTYRTIAKEVMKK